MRWIVKDQELPRHLATKHISRIAGFPGLVLAVIFVSVLSVRFASWAPCGLPDDKTQPGGLNQAIAIPVLVTSGMYCVGMGESDALQRSLNKPELSQ